ncbi:hypothetical protein [Ottowia sp. VDI28]|uniref:hypothetical protein n=1 Tax=Ottowia sp. VDI28 TaxID=3133968 RepID=UPI003C3095B7
MNVARSERWERRNDHIVYQWLSNQPGFNRSISLAFSEKRIGAPLVNWGDICPRHVEAICNAKTPGVARQKIQVASDILRPHYWWESYLIRALDEYLHVNHDELFLATARVNKNCETILKLINEIKPAIDADGWDSEKIGKNVIRQVEFWGNTLGPYGLLKSRNNKFKAEHRFIERMYSANLRFFRTAKPQIIAELMTLECFDRQFDLRHIGRLCSAIKMTRSEQKRQTSVMANKTS